MSEARTNERAFNLALSDALRKRHPQWDKAIRVESTRVIASAPRSAPDIVLNLPDLAPVVIETEFLPAASVEEDAKNRLGAILGKDGRAIEQAIAVRVPTELQTAAQGENLNRALENAELQYCIWSQTPDRANMPHKQARWPKKDWLHGSINDLANCMEMVSLSESLVSRSTDALAMGVAQAADILKNASSDIQERIGKALYQDAGEQTNRMAAAIIANALLFHTRIEGKGGVPLVADMTDSSGSLVVSEVRKIWNKILTEINYWPIFSIALELLSSMTMRQAQIVLTRLHKTADELTQMGAHRLNDLSGRMFQKLITDRKFLATFYTLPVSATLLAELAAARLNIDWADADAVAGLRVADFACGTGALIGALYHAVLSRHRRAGGDDAAIHARMIEKAMYAFDIMPAATHLAASTLSSAHPSIIFGSTQVATMRYGKEGGEEWIGSLDLLQTRPLLALDLGKQHAGRQHKSKPVHLPPETLDVVIMNPPFTRPTNHKMASGVPVPSFAGFGTTHDEQRAMSRRLAQLRRNLAKLRGKRNVPAGHGNAGLASNFMDLAHDKLKPGGVLALVLPAAFVQGESWEAARNLLTKHYRNLCIISITASGQYEYAFSADTGMGEILLLAEKNKESDKPNQTCHFINLQNRPATHVEALEVSKYAAALPPKSDRAETAHKVSADISPDGNASHIVTPELVGGCAGLVHADLAPFMLALHSGTLRLPRLSGEVAVPMTYLEQIGKRGHYDLDLTGGLPHLIGKKPRPGASPRGPFEKTPLREGEIPTYPCLWAHHIARERSFFVAPDHSLTARPGEENRAKKMWDDGASRLHLSRDFGINGSSLAACLTKEKSLGGRAWPNFILGKPEYEKAMMLWFNSTLGLMAHWWKGARQQRGRSILTITRLPSLPCWDPRKFDEETLRQADDVFDEFAAQTFLPANEAYHDPARHALDEAVLRLLNVPDNLIGGMKLIRHQWCAEPSVHGGKKTQP